MTPQEALTLLNDVEFADKYQGKDEYTDMLLMCKSALEKQIPKKVKKTAEYLNGAGEWEAEYECATCENPYIDDSYCSCCGQALDWSDTE